LQLRAHLAAGFEKEGLLLTLVHQEEVEGAALLVLALLFLFSDRNPHLEIAQRQYISNHERLRIGFGGRRKQQQVVK
jgi:hypothetical protein